MKKMNNKWLALSLTAVFSLTLLTACSTPSAQSTQDTPQGVGTLLLSVNPEIQISYDDEGNVVALTGQNEDGKQVVSAFQEAKGQPCEKVVPALVERIHEDGYFDDTIDGNEKNIILKLERGSEYPSDDFLNQLAVAVQAVVDDDHIGSQTMTLDDDDYDPAYAQQGYISAKAAQELLAAQLNRSDLQFVEKEYDLSDGEYEISFVLDGVEYEYEVNASTGKVTEMDAEQAEGDDDWDDDQYDDWDDDQYDDWDDDQDDDWDDDQYDDWDDDQDDDWDDDQDDDWDDDQYDDWDDDRDDDWDDDQDDDWDDDQDDDWDDDRDDDRDDDQDDDRDDDRDDDWDDDQDDDWDDDRDDDRDDD